MQYTDDQIRNVKPDSEQLRRATYSHRRWCLNYFQGLCYSPFAWAVACLQNEMITGGPVIW